MEDESRRGWWDRELVAELRSLMREKGSSALLGASPDTAKVSEDLLVLV